MSYLNYTLFYTFLSINATVDFCAIMMYMRFGSIILFISARISARIIARISASIIARISASLIGGLIFSCVGNSNDNTAESSQNNTALSWQQIFLGEDYNRSINYENYSDAEDFGDESTRKILWKNSQYTILGSAPHRSDVYMESIEIMDTNNTIHNFPRDIVFVKSVVNGESIVKDDIALEIGMGAGYEIQILPDNNIYDFNGDGNGDIFFGLNQSGTRSKFVYYVITKNERNQKLECIGFQIGESWITEQYITEKIPVGYKVDMLYYIIYPIKEYAVETYQLRQVFRLYSQTGEEMKSKETTNNPYSTDEVKGVFILDWQYIDDEWSIAGHNVNLTGKIQLSLKPTQVPIYY